MFYQFKNIDRKYLYKRPGIYRITNEHNGKIYIGSAVDLYQRFIEHSSTLRKGNHFNKHLQRAYNKYKEENFTLEVLQECNENDLIFYEQKYLDITLCFNNKIGYNISSIAGNTLGFRFSKEQRKQLSNRSQYKDPKFREKISKSLLGKKQTEETKAKRYKKIIRINNTGDQVEYKSIKEACEKNALNNTKMWRLLNNLCENDTNFKWIRNDNT
jgi:group I intron endonuclease